MSIAFYTGVSGMMASQKFMDATAHNMANVNTTGFKTQNASFQDLIYTKMNIHKNYGLVEGADGQPANETDIPEEDRAYDMVGHGVKVGSVHLMYQQGGFNFTESSLDFAIDGEGLFAVKNGKDEIEYTRNGHFNVSLEGRKAYLVNSQGYHVLDRKGKAVVLTMEDGVPQTFGLAEDIGVYHFTNPYGLIPTDGGSFLESENSGEAKAMKAGETTSTVLQGWLENSNVQLSDQMVNLIQAQRTFQLNSRVVQTADQIDEMINNLR